MIDAIAMVHPGHPGTKTEQFSAGLPGATVREGQLWQRDDRPKVFDQLTEMVKRETAGITRPDLAASVYLHRKNC